MNDTVKKLAKILPKDSMRQFEESIDKSLKDFEKQADDAMDATR